MSGIEQLILMFIEAFILSIFLYILTRLKPWLGTSPLLVTLGSLQFVQVILAMSLYIEVLPGLLISPGSSVFFVGTILGVLLIYIIDDALGARKLIYSLLIANVFLSIATISISQHFLGEDVHLFIDLPREVFLQHPRVMIVGTFALFIDTILVIIIYDLLVKLKSLFLRILITLSIVLIFDSLVFITGVFIENENYFNMLISSITGKLLTVPVFALGIVIVEKLMKRQKKNETKTVKDFFNLLTYREKFEKASKELSVNNERFQKLTDNITSMLYQFILTPNGTSKFTYVSNGVINMYEISPEELKNDVSLAFKCVHKEDIEMLESSTENSAKTMEEWNLEYRVNLPKKGLRWHHGHSKPEKLEDGTILWYGSIIDITEQKEKDRLLYQQSKMAAMGEMIGNIAHQWRQPLSVISTAATGAKLQNELGLLNQNNMNSYFDTINNTSQYLSQTIEDFRSFFNPQNNKIKEFKISDAIDKSLKLVSAQFATKDIEITENIKDFEIKAIENELVQVFINILNNARDALITKKNQKRLIFINSYKKDDILFIEIVDNAGGIPDDIIDRVFEPYFTTKHKSQGTGIGLYMSEEIIRNHLNGTINVENETYIFEKIEYRGAKFTISLPIVS